MLSFFDINNIAFTILGYQISWLELAGTIFNLVCVILAARRKISNWWVGLVGVVLFMILFYQIQLIAHCQHPFNNFSPVQAGDRRRAEIAMWTPTQLPYV